MTKRFDLSVFAAMVAVLLLAAVVRITNIDGPALWTDEGFVYYTFKVDLFDALLGDRHPPFYFYTLHAWEAVAGDSILALRWWSLLPSLLTVAVVYQIGRELRGWLPGMPAGALGLPVLAALLLTLADAENYMAQELRMYTWHVLFAAGSTWAYLRWVRLTSFSNQSHAAHRSAPFRRQSVGGLGLIIIWVTLNTLLLYTHYFGGFVLLVQGLHALIFLHDRRRWWAVGVLALTGALFAPWFLGVTLRQFADEPVSLTAAAIAPLDVLLDFREKWLGAQWPLMLALFGAGVLTLVPRRGVKNAGLLFYLIALIVIPVALTFVIGHDELILLARRLVQITVPVALLVALGISRFPLGARAVIVTALVLYGVTTVDWYRVKVPWHTVTDLIAEYAQPGELALMDVAFEESALLYYYDHRLPDGMQISSYPVWSDQPRFDYYEIELPALLREQDALQSGVVTAWVTFFSPDPGILARLDAAGFQRTMTRPYEHVGSVIDVYRYDRLPDDTSEAAFINGMTLEAVETVPDELRVDLWWGAATPIDADYTVSAALLDEAGQLVAQLDSAPQTGARPTSTIAPGEVVYDPRPLQTISGEPLPSGMYTVVVQVYLLTPEGLIPVQTAAGETTVAVGRLTR